MRITLLYPPAAARHMEPFPMPSLSLAVLANLLRPAGHEVRIVDLDVIYHRDRGVGPLASPLLRDGAGLEGYLAGKAPRAAARRYEALEGELLELAAMGEPDLLGVTLVDHSGDLFPVRVGALLARALKARRPAKAAIGMDSISREVYRDLLRRFPPFDWAFYLNGGPAVLRLVKRLEGGKARLSHVLERRGREVRDSGMVLPPRPICDGPDYQGYPLEPYSTTLPEVLARYDCRSAAVRALLRRPSAGRELVVFYGFDTTCRAGCIFCSNATQPHLGRRSVAAIIEDLRRLKELGVTGVHFINPNFNDDYAFAEELCRRMISARLGLLWSDCANFRELDEALLMTMRRAGCVKLVLGAESCSARMLRYIRKGTTKARIKSLLEASHRVGIWNHVDLIAGMPTETDADVAETTGFLREVAPFVDAFTINPFFLHHRSPIYMDPGRYGIRLCREDKPGEWDAVAASPAAQLGFDTNRFDEVGGLAWCEKSKQMRRSMEALRDATRRCEALLDAEHLQLLMHLYRTFGHGRKDLIRRIMHSAARSFKPYNSDQPAYSASAG
ncbi:MAG: radical SAM protein [Elusimicrobia bacterium]|nr:radical SAM protein [Elusimicrobiota bacterium]